MNDRYLYRAKRKNWRELPKEKWWVTGYLVNKKCGKYNTFGFEEFEEMVIVTQFSDGGIDWCYIEKDTICQCTGLKDKNGNLIWENDIVRDDNGNLYKAFWQDRYYQFSWICVKSDKLPIGAKWDFWSIRNYEIEVIGNIFDNPELLESEG